MVTTLDPKFRKPSQGTETGIDAGKNVTKKPLSPKQICKAQGGKWDEDSQQCISKVNLKEIQEQEKESKPKGTAGAYNAERGGFVTDEGKLFPTDNPDFVPNANPYNNVIFNKDNTVTVSKGDVTKTLSKEEHEALRGGGGMLSNQVKELSAVPSEQQAALLESLGGLGEVGQLTPTQPASLDWGQAISAALAGSASYAAGGAALGLVTTGGAGSVPLAVAGGVGGFVTSLLSNIKSQQQGEIGAANVELTAARTQMRQLAMLASRDPANVDMYISWYNEQKTRIYQAQRQLKSETSGNLKTWGDDGRKDLANFDAFLRAGGLSDIYAARLQASLQTGVPLSIQGEELVFDN